MPLAYHICGIDNDQCLLWFWPARRTQNKQPIKGPGKGLCDLLPKGTLESGGLGARKKPGLLTGAKFVS